MSQRIIRTSAVPNRRPMLRARAPCLGARTTASRTPARASRSYATTPGGKIHVKAPGLFSLVQDYPGREGLWRIGVPPSGPMDHYAFQIANRLAGNEAGVPGLELTYTGPTLIFDQDTTIALCGAKMNAELDGKPLPLWQSVNVHAGQTLTMSGIEGAGARSYLAVQGGIKVPEYLGSGASFPLGKLGGKDGDGAPLKAGDELHFTPAAAAKGGKKKSKDTVELPKELIPEYSHNWKINVLPGPQEAPDFFTKEDIEMFYNTEWEVSHNASRLGVRLIGPKLKFARPDGGEGGSHPSNLHDNAYAIGSINFTGDHPVVLMVDGPSLGGFVCPATVPLADRWKIGQLKPGDKIRFTKATLADAMKDLHAQNSTIAELKAPSKPAAPFIKKGQDLTIGTRAVVKLVEATPSSHRIEYRMAGDRYLLVEYGDRVLDLNLRMHAHALEQFLQKAKVKGIEDTIPGVRSLLIQYNPTQLALPDLMKVLTQAEDSLPSIAESKVRSRIFRLPMAFRDKWTRAAIDKYMQTVRATAPYLPDNVEFIARNNGLSSAAEVQKMIYDTSYMVMGLGDVYLGAPCAVPLDPRQRLVVPKYNPARTFTPEGAVGIGGAYMCIYPMESPGGYQLIGRSLPIWNTRGNTPSFTPKKPWLLDMFDQVKFELVSEEELEKQREAFAKGELNLQVQETTFNLKEYNQFVKGIEGEVAALKERQKKAQAQELAKDAAMLATDRQKSEEVPKIVRYLADMVVNGPDHPGAVGQPPSTVPPIIPAPRANAPAGTANAAGSPPRGLKQVFEEEGAEGFARAVRKHRGLLLTDTTWRDAHQSLLATRIRTVDLKNIAQATAHVLAKCYSIEMWGGATFDVALRFLHECPWDRLAELREMVPNVPFQMLLRGANAVGYTSYPDNVVYEFCKQAKRTGMDVFRVFDSLNYIENMKLGIDAVGSAGGIVEAAICYTGDVADPTRTKYTLDYYLQFARQLVDRGIHVLCVKDMAGLMKPTAAKLLIGALRREFPDMPIHVHAHDTAGTGVASMIACYEAGADAVDCANDAMSGLTSQPAMGALVHNYAYTEHDTGVKLADMLQLTTYWEGARRLYRPFESGAVSAGADVYLNEIPGGQYTNMQFQALSLGIISEWDAIKRAYAEANQVLGDLVKVTPSSKVVGDLAQFMVTNKLDRAAVEARADQLDFPSSVIEFLQGYLGQPVGGFPEPFRTKALKGKPIVDGRPGASMKAVDFAKITKDLTAKYGPLRDVDVMSHIQYPKVFEEFAAHRKQFGRVDALPTRQFLQPMAIGEEVKFSLDGKEHSAKLLSVKDADKDGNFPVQLSINGQTQTFTITPKKKGLPPFIKRATTTAAGAPAQSSASGRPLADKANSGHIGAPMPGKVVDVRVAVGDLVQKGQPVAVLSAMKMETVVSATMSGKVQKVYTKKDETVGAGDLLVEIGTGAGGSIVMNLGAPTAGKPSPVAAPMPGKIVDIKVAVGAKVAKGQAIAVLSAMKMETVVSATVAGTVTKVYATKDDMISAGHALLDITP